jgi:hypothetical protein
MLRWCESKTLLNGWTILGLNALPCKIRWWPRVVERKTHFTGLSMNDTYRLQSTCKPKQMVVSVRTAGLIICWSHFVLKLIEYWRWYWYGLPPGGSQIWKWSYDRWPSVAIDQHWVDCA